MRTSGALVLAVLTVVSCSREVGEETATAREGPPPYPLAGASVRDDGGAPAPVYRTYLYSEHDADVYSRISDDESSGGRLVRQIRAEVGDNVQAGDVLAVLDDDEATLEVRAARADAEEARSHFARMEELHAAEVVSLAEYEAAGFALQRAEAALGMAELVLARTRVRAPFAGIVSRRYVRVGQKVDEATPLFRVTAMAPLRARLLVPEEEVAIFRPGTRVVLRSATDDTAAGRVLLVGPAVDPASGTREVVVELADPGTLRPGAAVDVRPRAGMMAGEEQGPRTATGGTEEGAEAAITAAGSATAPAAPPARATPRAPATAPAGGRQSPPAGGPQSP